MFWFFQDFVWFFPKSLAHTTADKTVQVLRTPEGNGDGPDLLVTDVAQLIGQRRVDRWRAGRQHQPAVTVFQSLDLLVEQETVTARLGRGRREPSDDDDVDFVEGRTTDDHLVLAVDHRVVDGVDWYLIKNSHGTSSGRRGYVWIRGDWMAMRVLAYMVHPEALDSSVLDQFGGDR